MLNKKFVCVLNYFKINKVNKVAPKNNPRTHSLQQNKKAVLTTAACFKVSIPIRSQRQLSNEDNNKF